MTMNVCMDTVIDTQDPPLFITNAREDDHVRFDCGLLDVIVSPVAPLVPAI